MDKPIEIDLYDWTQYSIFRALLKKPFPSPRVWDNAGTCGYRNGNYKKDNVFDKHIFDPFLFQYEEPSYYKNLSIY